MREDCWLVDEFSSKLIPDVPDRDDEPGGLNLSALVSKPFVGALMLGALLGCLFEACCPLGRLVLVAED